MALAKFGYGYSLGDSVKGVWKFGVGPFQSKYSATTNSTTVTGKKTSMGSALQVGFLTVMPVGGLDFTVGLEVTRLQINPGQSEDGVTLDSVSLNTPELRMGIRF
jgi:hypothetical protein